MVTTIFRSNEPKLQGLTPRELRRKLLQQSYAPIAIVGKKPIAAAWQIAQITPDSINAEISLYPSATNTGLRTDQFPVVDIDLWDDDHVGDVGCLVADHLGPTPLLRRGRKGLAMCYRLDGDPIGKLVVKEDSGKRTKPTPMCPNGNPIYRTVVEILGKGNQVVGYGIHPETGNPYEWVGDSEPLLTSFGDLPAVTPNQIRELVEAIREECARLGYKVKGVGIEGVT